MDTIKLVQGYIDVYRWFLRKSELGTREYDINCEVVRVLEDIIKQLNIPSAERKVGS